MSEEQPKKPDEGDATKAADGAGGVADEEESDGRTHPFGWVGLIVIAVLVVGGWFLITNLSDETKMQDCIQSGRRNCAPIDTAGK
jgi:hypothetical protein